MTAHLVHVPLDMSAFDRWVRERGLLGRRTSFDAGYALHVLLSTTFGKSVLQPFRLFAGSRRAAALYAYADADQVELRSVASAAATPDCLAVLDPSRLLTRPLPRHFAADQRLGFDIRVRPVRRLQRDLAIPHSGKVLRQGVEVDVARLHALRPRLRPGSAEGRAELYAAWLRERCGDAVRIETCRLSAFGRSRASRGDGPGPEGPDATLHGLLAIRDPAAFGRLVRNGVGRHRAYGYGMLLLRPPGR